MSKLFSAVSVLALVPGLSLAEATPQGAADLTALFQSYLGSIPGVVEVTTEGDAYAVTLDAAPLFALIPAEAGATVSMTALTMLLTDNGDGTWGIAQDQPMSLKMSVPGAMEMSIDIARAACAGTFDAALMAYSQSDCVLDNMTTSQIVTDPMAGEQVSNSTLTQMVWTSTAVPGANGGVDGTQVYSATGVSQTMNMPLEPGAPPVTIAVTLDSYSVNGTTTGLRPEAFLGALAWFVANPGEAAILANRGELKSILEGSLPLFEKITATGTGSNLSVMTPVGPVTATGLGFDIEMAGAVENGLFREAISLSGVTPPPGVLPPFAEPLMPTDATIDIGVDSFNAAAAAQVLLGLFDLVPGTEPGPEFEAALMNAFMPDGTVDIFAGPGSISNELYTLSWEGRMQAGPSMMVPTGTATVTATGLDAVMTSLQSAPPEVVMQILPVLGMAQGLAQPGPDGALVWEIDASAPGTLLINGMDLMGMQ